MQKHSEMIKEIEQAISYGITMEYFFLRNKELYKGKIEDLMNKGIEEIKNSDFDIGCDNIVFGRVPFISEMKGTNEIVYVNTIDFKGSVTGRKNNRVLSLRIKCCIEAYWSDKIDVLDSRNRVFNIEDQEIRIQELLAGSPKID